MGLIFKGAAAREGCHGVHAGHAKTESSPGKARFSSGCMCVCVLCAINEGDPCMTAC